MNQPGKSSRAVSKSFLTHSQNSEPKSIQQRFSLNQITTYRSTFEEDLQQLAKSSLSSIGLWTNKLIDLDPSQVAAQIACADLNVSSVSFVGGFTGSMGATYREALDEAFDTLFLAAAVKAHSVVVAPGARGKYTANHERKLVCSAIRELAMLAAELDINLAVLPMKAEFAGRWTDLHSFDAAMDVVMRVDHPRVGVAFDTFHLLDDKILARLPKIAGDIMHVQISDRVRRARDEYARFAPGEGNLPLVEMIRALEQANYTGYFDIQVWSNELWQLSSAEIVQRCEEWIRCVTADETISSETIVV